MRENKTLGTKFGDITYQERHPDSRHQRFIDIISGRFVGRNYDICLSTLDDGERNYEVIDKTKSPPECLPADYDPKDPIDVFQTLQDLENLLNNPEEIDEKARAMLSMLEFAYAECDMGTEEEENLK